MTGSEDSPVIYNTPAPPQRLAASTVTSNASAASGFSLAPMLSSMTASADDSAPTSTQASSTLTDSCMTLSGDSLLTDTEPVPQLPFASTPSSSTPNPPQPPETPRPQVDAITPDGPSNITSSDAVTVNSTASSKS